MENVLIAGASGFVGVNLAFELLKNNYTVYGIDNFSNGEISLIYPLLRNKNFFFSEQNLLNKIDFTVDKVFYCACNSDFRLFYENKYDFCIEQIEIIKNLLEYSKNSGAEFYYITYYLNDNIIKADNLLLSMFSMIEKLIIEYSKKYLIKYKIIKTSYLYGINFSKNDKKPINTILLDILNNKDITINYDEEIYSTYIEDFCSEIIKIIPFSNKKICELCSKNKYLLSDYAKLIKQISQSNSKIEIKNSNIITLSYSANNSDLSNPTSLLDGLIKTVDFAKMMYFN